MGCMLICAMPTNTLVLYLGATPISWCTTFVRALVPTTWPSPQLWQLPCHVVQWADGPQCPKDGGRWTHISMSLLKIARWTPTTLHIMLTLIPTSHVWSWSYINTTTNILLNVWCVGYPFEHPLMIFPFELLLKLFHTKGSLTLWPAFKNPITT
jgi:hypothetical protein